jgi:hypothetical protein
MYDVPYMKLAQSRIKQPIVVNKGTKINIIVIWGVQEGQMPPNTFST